MLILNLKIAKHFQHISVAAYHLNSDTNYSQWPGLSQENWKLCDFYWTFYVITKNNDKTKTETTLTPESLDFIH